MIHPDETSEVEFDMWLALDRATHKHRGALIADIVGHPKGTPTIEELRFMNQERGEEEIRRDLSLLEEANVVREVVVDEKRSAPRRSYHFYCLTEEARKLLKRLNLFPEAAWKRQYKRVEKPPEIRKFEQAPRPDCQ